ncbi:MAG: Na+/H+ antiporter subunit E [Acidobacteria bacterium]|nr:Na+/H+ antiporter subunit E [Acidobacteriota bacterium]
MANRWLPHPWLSVWLLGSWLLLMNSAAPGHLVLGTLLAVAVPGVARMFWPETLDIVRYRSVLPLFAVFLWDLFVANVTVAIRIVSFWRELRPRWIVIPLDLRNPTAIAVLANMISLTPGTVSSKLTADRLELLVHVLDTDDPEGEVETIKRRYEQPLQEIFQ